MRGYLAAVVILGSIAVFSAPEREMKTARAATSCPTGTGYGGSLTNDANSGLSAAGNGCVIIVDSGGTTAFVHTGADQTWTVPAGVTSVEFHLIGAGGGGGLQNRGGSSGSNGGGGGYATGRLAVNPGDQYLIIVGKGGRHQCVADLTTTDVTARRNYNYGGGAAGYGGSAWDCSWASGGGRSAVRTIAGTDDIITAGGGGGGGYDRSGGPGGGLNGVAGGANGYSTAGGGGTQTAGGAGGNNEPGYAGIQYAGGPAGLNTSSPAESGGGGGGYYGGGGGGNNTGGGGGSSYIDSARGLTAGSTVAGSGRIPGAVPPTNSAVPTISGTANVGQTLTATTGAWSGAATTTFRWQRSADNGATWLDIPGAVGATYVVGVSGRIRVVETAQNYFGTTDANSVATTAIVDTTLSALSVSDGVLSPSFSPGVLAYTVVVPYTTTAVTVTPTRTHASTTLTVNGATATSGAASSPIALVVGANTVTVVATNTGVSSTTTLTVVREAAVVPGAPVINTVTPGAGRLTVSFAVPSSDGGEPITDYEYSRNSGSWTSAGTTSSPFTITGLADGTTHSIRLRARNVVGAGTASAAVSGTTVAATTTTTAVPVITTTVVPVTTTPVMADPTLPQDAPIVQATTPTFPSGAATRTTPSTPRPAPTTTTEPPTTTTTTSTTLPAAPEIGADGVAIVVDGQELPVEISRDAGVVTASSGALRAFIAGVTSDGSVAPFDGEGNVRVGDKGRIRVGVEGFAAGSVVVVWLYSTPTRLGGVAVGSDGRAGGDLSIPSSVQDGLHVAVLRGTTDRGAPVQVAVSVVVGEPDRISPAGRVLLILALVLAALSALFIPAVVRRRKDDEEELDARPR